jgi:hypothetical protein
MPNVLKDIPMGAHVFTPHTKYYRAKRILIQIPSNKTIPFASTLFVLSFSRWRIVPLQRKIEDQTELRYHPGSFRISILIANIQIYVHIIF